MADQHDLLDGYAVEAHGGGHFWVCLGLHRSGTLPLALADADALRLATGYTIRVRELATHRIVWRSDQDMDARAVEESTAL